MLSGRGIDGELKSKFGELTEKFWKSGVINGDLRAIYFANEVGGNGSEGKSLSEMGGNNGKKLISTESDGEDKVQSLFNFCVGTQNGSGCQGKKNNESVVLVGSDNQLSPELKQKIKNEWNWTSGNGSVVDGSHKYSGIFNQIKKSDGNWPAASSFNRMKLPQISRQNNEGKVLLRHLCSWIGSVLRRKIREQCSRGDIENNEVERLTLTGFLASNFAKEYFQDGTWKQYKKGGNYLALLALMNLWSTDLAQMNFGLSKAIFETGQEKFKFEHLLNSNGKVVYLDADNSGSNLKTISYHSGGMWAVQLCSNSGGCSNGNGLNLTLGDGKFCVIKDVCFSKEDEKSVFQNGRAGWKSLRSGGDTALWSYVFKDQQAKSNVNNLFVALVVACFGDVKNVSLTVQKPSEGGKQIFKQLK